MIFIRNKYAISSGFCVSPRDRPQREVGGKALLVPNSGGFVPLGTLMRRMIHLWLRQRRFARITEEIGSGIGQFCSMRLEGQVTSIRETLVQARSQIRLGCLKMGKQPSRNS